MPQLDTRIPLFARSDFQPTLPSEFVGRSLTLTGLTNKNRIDEQAIQENEMKLDQMRQQVQAQQQVDQIMSAAPKDQYGMPDLKVALPQVLKLGPTVFGAALKYAELSKALSQADETQIKQLSEGVAQVKQSLYAIKALPEEQRAAAYQQTLQAAVQNKIIPQDQVGKTIPDRYLGPQMFDLFEMSLVPIEKQIEIATKRAQEQRAAAEEARKVQEFNATLPGKQADTAGKVAEQQAREAWLAANPGKTAADYEIDKKARETKASHIPVPGRDVPLPPAVASQQVSLSGQKAAAAQGAQVGGGGTGALYTGTAPGETAARNEDFLKTLPASTANQLKMLVDGRIPLPSGIAMSKPYWQNMLKLAAEYEPGFDATQWRVRQDTRVDFAKGKAALQIRSLNTLIKHLGQLWDAADKLDNTGITGGTKIGNYVVNLGKEQFGSEGLKDWDVAATAAGSELATLLKGGVPDKLESEQQARNFNRNDPKNAQREAIIKALELAFGRMSALDSQYENAFRKQKDFQYLNAAARKIVKDKLGVDPDRLEGAAQAAPTPQPEVDPKVKAYADKYFGGNVQAALDAIAQQRQAK